MDDKIIIQHYWDRNEIALTETAEKYDSFCRSIAENILHNREDAKECVNDTYLKTWNSLPPNRPRIFPAFLGRIVRNLAFDRYDHLTASKRGGGQIDVVLDELEECIPDASTEPGRDESDLSEAINDFVGSLPERNRIVFVMRYWYTDSIADIASELHMTESNVAVILSRLRNRLRTHLTERGFRP
ncbi:MAG: sigma-70 family RNA polymerase sigma factor [Oscillospiraceae bacterium]|nr:sigma-70 family RNA polymerase sigma factor [Oscillospiraceae bacterium]MBP1592831.1 sigma-70 family RNA polymerase sigma factor [Oscillospiraceae bacterium]